MTRSEPVGHNDQWFTDRGLPVPVTDWGRRQDEATLRSIHDAVLAAPPFSARQQVALRRIFGGLRRKMEAQAQVGSEPGLDPFRSELAPTGTG